MGGLNFNSPPAAAAFRIDHDQAFEPTTSLRYQHKEGPYADFTWRYDSGLIAGSEPDLASALALKGDEQAVIGLHCGNVYATPMGKMKRSLTLAAAGFRMAAKRSGAYFIGAARYRR